MSEELEPFDPRPLYAAILARAICDAYTKGGMGQSVRREARGWICNWVDSDSKEEFSFPWICEQLDVCPFRLRSVVANGGFTLKSKGRQINMVDLVQRIYEPGLEGVTAFHLADGRVRKFG